MLVARPEMVAGEVSAKQTPLRSHDHKLLRLTFNVLYGVIQFLLEFLDTIANSSEIGTCACRLLHGTGCFYYLFLGHPTEP